MAKNQNTLTTKFSFFLLSVLVASQRTQASEDIQAVPIAQFTPLGTMIQAHPRGTFYASHSSVFIDDDGKSYHTFYCSSVKPFSANEDPGWGTNEKNTFYGADAVRYDHFDLKLKRLSPTQTFLLGGLEFKPTLGLKTIKLMQSPCTSTTVKFNNQYYTFFESFADGSDNAQTVAIHVARAETPGSLDPWILTTSGWQKMRSTQAPWKPILRSKAFDNYPTHRNLINEGLTATRENNGPNSHGNYLWGVGVPSAVVRDNKIYLIAWDNIAHPQQCRLEKINGSWKIPPGVWCGSMILATSTDGENFSSTVRGDLPGGELKVINDPGSPKDGQFAVFSQILSDELKAKNLVGLNVAFFNSTLTTMTSVHALASIPSRVAADKYWDLGGIVAPRVAGNSLGEIAPFSKSTLLQMSLPRVSKYSKPASLAENREIFAWNFKITADFTTDTTPVSLAGPKELVDPANVPTILTADILKDNNTAYGAHLCGQAFTNQATVRAKWSHQSVYKWYKTDTAGNRAVHYIHPLTSPTGHARFCVVIALTSTDIANLRNGNTLSLQIYQPSANLYSGAKVFNGKNIP